MAFPSNSDSVAQDQIRAFVERIIRMKEEAADINRDIREIYAEAKANGFDKTVLGKVVSFVEKRNKDQSAALEAQALFDLYLEAFDGGWKAKAVRTGTVIATHTHEPETAPSGEARTEGAADGESPSPDPADVSGDQAGGEHETVTDARLDTETAPAERDGGMENVDTVKRADASETALGSDVESVAPIPARRRTAAENALALRPHCLSANDLTKCAGQGKVHCHECRKAHADVIGESA